MPIAIDPGKTWDYVLKCDRELPEEQRTVFSLRVLTAKQLAELEDRAVRSDPAGNLEYRTGTSTLQILKMGVTGWKNFRGADGSEIQFRENNGNPRDENWDLLRPEWRRELANAVTEQNRLSEEERKNS
jgi:hypothetical protein